MNRNTPCIGDEQVLTHRRQCDRNGMVRAACVSTKNSQAMYIELNDVYICDILAGEEAI
jgi:hypothetical protein